MTADSALAGTSRQDIAASLAGNVEELLDALCLDIEHIEKSLEWLNELRTFVIKRDDEALRRLLDTIRHESAAYASNELKRHSIRLSIAAQLGCEPPQVTLAILEEVFDGEFARRITETRQRLTELTAGLKNEHNATVVLLNDAARFNSMLLTQILNLGGAEAVTYSANGDADRRSGNAFMDMQF